MKPIARDDHGKAAIEKLHCDVELRRDIVKLSRRRIQPQEWNTLGNRRHIPFDVFAMQVEVPVSTMVCDDDHGWTCGQCPLDEHGQVVAPGNLVAQAVFVCDMIETVVRRGGFDNASVTKLNVYHSHTAHGEAQAALKVFHDRFAEGPVIVPIRVPHFYYDGMMIEVDVFTGPPIQARDTVQDGPGTLQTVRSGDLIWARVATDLTDISSLSDGFATTESLLRDHGLDADCLLSDHWFLSGNRSQQVRNADFLNRFVANPHALVVCPSGRSDALIGELTFATKPVTRDDRPEDGEGVTISGRRSDPFFWVSGVSTDPSTDLVEQTRSIMSGIERSLEAQGLSFDSVTKLTAHYAGGASPEELHGNMTVRHSYYSSPGPASTGLPVSGLLGPGCKIAIDAIACV